VLRIPDERMIKKVYKWKPMAVRSLGRPQTRWENDVKNYLNIMKIYNWKDCIQDRHKWGKKWMRRPKHSIIEVVEPEEEEEEEERNLCSHYHFFQKQDDSNENVRFQFNCVMYEQRHNPTSLASSIIPSQQPSLDPRTTAQNYFN
jgi:hypothetical protein